MQDVAHCRTYCLELSALVVFLHPCMSMRPACVGGVCGWDVMCVNATGGMLAARLLALGRAPLAGTPHGCLHGGQGKLAKPLSVRSSSESSPRMTCLHCWSMRTCSLPGGEMLGDGREIPPKKSMTDRGFTLG